MGASVNATTSGGRGFNLKAGSSTFSGTGIQTSFLIPHGLGITPTYYNVTPTSLLAAVLMYVSADSTNLTVTCITAPLIGTNNLTFNWMTAS